MYFTPGPYDPSTLGVTYTTATLIRMADLANEPAHLREKRIAREFEQQIAIEAQAESLRRDLVESRKAAKAKTVPHGVSMTRRALIGAVSGFVAAMVRVLRRGRGA
ncbi:MAG: hypothetical protein GY851_02780 [bacterium]|nr:hypothetical protein [bacterium]